MMCPKCRDEHEPMCPEVYQGIQIERCPVCNGLFLDRGELTQLIQSKQGSRADSLSFSAISETMDAISAHCPRCDQNMPAVMLRGNVKGNQCQSCGAIFLDQGELASLQLTCH